MNTKLLQEIETMEELSSFCVNEIENNAENAVMLASEGTSQLKYLGKLKLPIAMLIRGLELILSRLRNNNKAKPVFIHFHDYFVRVHKEIGKAEENKDYDFSYVEDIDFKDYEDIDVSSPIVSTAIIKFMTEILPLVVKMISPIIKNKLSVGTDILVALNSLQNYLEKLKKRNM